MSIYKTIKEIAAQASVSERTIRKWAREGRFPVYRPEGATKILIREAEFDAFLKGSRISIERDPDLKSILAELLG